MAAKVASTRRQGRDASPVWPLQPPLGHHRPNTDEVKLLMLGYRQELVREFTWLNSFGSGFVAQSALTGVSGAYGVVGLVYGGPRVMMWGWLVVSIFSGCVVLSLAELSSAYPTSGAMYYWSFKLAPPRLRNLACWLTAWLLTAAQAATCSIACYTFVYAAGAAVELQYGIQLTNAQHYACLLAALFVIGLLNCGSARLTAYMTTLGTFWHIVAVAALCMALPFIAPGRQSAKYIFTSWQPNYEVTGFSNPVYTAIVGLLLALMTFIGYDGPAHVAEQTLHAERNVPRAMVCGISAVSATGFAILIALTAVRIDGYSPVAVLFNPGNETRGKNAVLQLMIEATRADGDIRSAVALYSVFVVGSFFGAYQAFANNARLLYALGRDHVVPMSGIARRLHPGTKAPVAAAGCLLVLAALIGLPACFNKYSVAVILSFLVMGSHISYALPILCKLCTGRRYFLPGPFTLGPRLSYANNVVSLLWVAFVTVLFSLPQVYPITVENFNWAAPTLGAVVTVCLAWYYCPKYGAVHWFVGPRASLGRFQDDLPSMRGRVAMALEQEEVAAEDAELSSSRASRAAEAAAEMLRRVLEGRSSGYGTREGGSSQRESCDCAAGAASMPGSKVPHLKPERRAVSLTAFRGPKQRSRRGEVGSTL